MVEIHAGRLLCLQVALSWGFIVLSDNEPAGNFHNVMIITAADHEYYVSFSLLRFVSS